MHKIVKNEAPGYLTARISYRRDIHMHNTRRKNLLNTTKLKKSIKKGAFFYATVNSYNELLEKDIIKTDISVSMFVVN